MGRVWKFPESGDRVELRNRFSIGKFLVGGRPLASSVLGLYVDGGGMMASLGREHD